MYATSIDTEIYKIPIPERFYTKHEMWFSKRSNKVQEADECHDIVCITVYCFDDVLVARFSDQEETLLLFSHKNDIGNWYTLDTLPNNQLLWNIAVTKILTHPCVKINPVFLHMSDIEPIIV